MEVALTKDLEELIAEQVASGRYPSPGEVVRDALRLFQELLVLRERKLETLRRDIHSGLEALEGGEYEEYAAYDVKSLAAEVKASGRERLTFLPRMVSSMS
ncbi:MAG TPA: type II toxin-antitoxin system ParD family antitoxin [Thermoanaerobaculia bacterium]|nr:type II toxin-antitoxin system ParD family antitoxin [Thermoanaerobaculia bacterium]